MLKFKLTIYLFMILISHYFDKIYHINATRIKLTPQNRVLYFNYIKFQFKERGYLNNV
ncbi:predicted protein [Listeria monocytogenes F6900]|nr:predicted protein [Listeria monocytogenes FSL R2-503]EEW23537.1 predicted protein [Listeria monocytogenes F6900]EFF96605.1 predicted protein [Listeria monocytogenes HPB2262]EFG02911.1 predicted protein [Listeria monocytogenes FSL J1-194]EFK41464.1 predicted protein [Listeria monocytogenes FSL N1-017]